MVVQLALVILAPCLEAVLKAIQEGELVAASVLSGNRNFEGRISPHIKANFLASPPLVIAYALAGNINVDLTKDALGEDASGKPVYLSDIWPSQEEVRTTLAQSLTPTIYAECYKNINTASHLWQKIPIKKQALYDWKAESTYIQEPDFFRDMPQKPLPLQDISNARCLAKLGDSVTTDHISPAGAIPADMPAGRYLQEKGVNPNDFNSFGSRRGE